MELQEEAGEDLTLFVMAAEATTTESFAMNYNDGIDLYSRWDAWSAQVRKFAPREMLGTMQTSNGSWAFVSRIVEIPDLLYRDQFTDHAFACAVLLKRDTLG